MRWKLSPQIFPISFHGPKKYYSSSCYDRKLAEAWKWLYHFTATFLAQFSLHGLNEMLWNAVKKKIEPILRRGFKDATLRPRQDANSSHGYPWPAPRTKLNSSQVHMRNSAGILVLGPNLCTRIWVRAMTGLLKKPLSFCESGWKDFRNVRPITRWVRWGPRTRISALLLRRY